MFCFLYSFRALQFSFSFVIEDLKGAADSPCIFFFLPDRLKFKMFLALHRTVFLGGQADGVCNYMKDGLMGLVTYRSARSPLS